MPSRNLMIIHPIKGTPDRIGKHTTQWTIDNTSRDLDIGLNALTVETIICKRFFQNYKEKQGSIPKF